MRHLPPSIFVLVIALAAPAAATPPTGARASSAVREADRALYDASLAGRRLLVLLDQTRVRGDRRRASCVDEKLSEVNSFGRMLEDRRQRLVDAEGRADQTGAAHERMVVRALHGQLRRAEREGRQCVFPEAEADGRTIVTVTVSADVPDEDPSLLTEADRQRRF